MEVNTVILVMCVLNSVINTILIAIVVYFGVKQKFMEYALDNIPDPQKLIEDMMKTRIPILIGPDGQPMLQTQSKNPLVG